LDLNRVKLAQKKKQKHTFKRILQRKKFGYYGKELKEGWHKLEKDIKRGEKFSSIF